ncbi:MAG: EamA family transporter [Candidatus Gottesmanbacteria bacterium]
MSARKKAILALIIANIIWGGASPIFKWGLTNIAPFTLAFIRFAGAAIIILPFTYKKIFNINKQYINKIILFGFLGVTLNISFFFAGLKLSPSINASIIAATEPLILLLIGAFLLKENVERHEIVGTLISLFGVFTIILLPILSNGLSGELMALGNFFFIIAALGAVGQAFFGKQLFKYNDTLPITFWSFLIGAVSFLPVFIIELIDNPLWYQHLDKPGLTAIFYGIFFSSALAYFLYDWGLSKIEASETGIFTYIMPITALLIAVPFFGEKITWQFILGTLFIVTGIIIAQIHLHKKPSF